MTLEGFRNFVFTFMLQTSTGGTLGNPGLSRTGNDEVDDFIHMAHLELFTKITSQGNRYFHKTALVNETAAGKVYDLPLDLYRLIRIERVAGGGGTPIPYSMSALGGSHYEIEARRLSPSSFANDPVTEAYYTHGQKQFELVNASVVSQASAFKVYYIARPAKMTAVGHVPFQSPAATAPVTAYDNLDEWHDIIAWRALEMALLKCGDTAATAVGAKAVARERDLMRFLGDANKHARRSVTYTRSGE